MAGVAEVRIRPGMAVQLSTICRCAYLPPAKIKGENMLKERNNFYKQASNLRDEILELNLQLMGKFDDMMAICEKADNKIDEQDDHIDILKGAIKGLSSKVFGGNKIENNPDDETDTDKNSVELDRAIKDGEEPPLN